MSDPTPLDPETDVTSKAKLNHLCEKCSRVAHQVMMLQKSCSTDPDNPTVHMIDHHDSSTALITSARDGCHLCTLLLRIYDVTMKTMQIIEAKNYIDRRQPDRKLKSSYQIKLSGHLDYKNAGWRHSMYRVTSKALKISMFEWRRIERNVSIAVVLPYDIKRHDIDRNAVHWWCAVNELYIKHLFGLSTLRSLFHLY